MLVVVFPHPDTEGWLGATDRAQREYLGHERRRRRLLGLAGTTEDRVAIDLVGFVEQIPENDAVVVGEAGQRLDDIGLEPGQRVGSSIVGRPGDCTHTEL